MKATRYTWINPASEEAPTLEEIGFWPTGGDDLARAVGADPEDEDLQFTNLVKPWGKHPAGACVLVGLTCEGHPFWIFEEGGLIDVE